MNLTDEQREAVGTDEHTLIAACPGSGKTRAIVAKLLRCVEDVRNTPRRVACITYTNAAVDEIEYRLRVMGSADDVEYCQISTIHAFCLQSVLRNFFWRLPEYKNGFMVLPSDDDIFRAYAEAICKHHKLSARAREEFEQLIRKPDGTALPTQSISVQAAADFWSRLQKDGYIDFPSILYHSYRLMKAPTICDGIAAKFAWMLVDEFQDTNAIQVAILSFIAQRQQTKFFIVGDELQSIFGFAGAEPELMRRFAGTLGVSRPLSFTGNFRSSRRIVAHAERLCPRDSEMKAVGENADVAWTPEHIHASSAFIGLTDYFLPSLIEREIPFGRSAVLAPAWFKLFSLGRQLREYGIPITGPGSRPYQRSHLFAALAEVVCAHVERPERYLFEQIEREIFRIVVNFSNILRYDVFSFFGRRVAQRLVEAGVCLRGEHEGGSDWLRHAASKFGSILVEEELLPNNAPNLFLQSAEDMIRQMRRNDVDVVNFRTAELGLFARNRESLKLLTIHRSKGLEFDAVAIVDLHEGRIPHSKNSDTEEDLFSERRRLYVAITRAERFLMYITDMEDDQNRPSRFLRDLFGGAT